MLIILFQSWMSYSNYMIIILNSNVEIYTMKLWESYGFPSITSL